MGKTSSARKTAYKYARSKEDVAQNRLIKELERDVASMKQTVERKYSYVAGLNSLILPYNNAARSTGFNQIRIGTVQGDGDSNERIGDTVSLKTISLKYNLQLNGAEPHKRVRVMLLWDKEPVIPNAAGVYVVNPPQWQQLLQAVTVTGAGDALCILSPKDHDTGHRFGVLYDEVTTLVGDAQQYPTVAGNLANGRIATNTKSFSKAYKVGKKLRYTDGGTQPNNHTLYLAAITDGTSAISLPTAMNFSLKCIYEDA